jgi:RNA polymerase sigma factor (sigma-70 family)
MPAAATAKTVKPSNVVSPAAFRAHRSRVLARRDALVERHLGLVRTIALRIHDELPPSFELDDLISAGNIGLLRAATRYRPRVHGGTPFRIFAQIVIRGAILDSVNKRHYAENTRPSIDECVEPGADPVVEISIDRRRRLAKVRDAMLYLPKPQQAVLRRYYAGLDVTFEAVGKRLGVGRTKTRKLHDAAISELRRILHVR